MFVHIAQLPIIDQSAYGGTERIRDCGCRERRRASVLKKKIQPAFKRIGITGVGWHTFRHTVGTMLTEMGEHQLMIRDYLASQRSARDQQVSPGNDKKQSLAQGKLVDAILPGGVLSGSKSNLIH
jgi:hypothetical protein